MSEVTDFESMGGQIILMGDTNARIGDAYDYIENEDACDYIENEDDLDENLPLPGDYIPDNNNVPLTKSSMEILFESTEEIY